MRWALCLLLAGCSGVLTKPSVPSSSALNALDRQLADEARQGWRKLKQPKLQCAERYPKVMQIGGDAFIEICRVYGPCSPGARMPCADSCYARLGGYLFDDDEPYLVVHESKPRCFWVHEYFHHLESCARIRHDRSPGREGVAHQRAYWRLLPPLELRCHAAER